MPKAQHSKDKLYLNPKEFAEFWGGYKDKAKVPFRTLPFNCCALSLLPFDDPVCTREGHVFDVKRIIPYIKRHGRNPVTGQPLKVQDLTAIIWHKNSESKYHCPVTFKVFTDNTHIVANRKSGHVYEYTTIEQLCKKTKSWQDLITGEPFSSSDVVHLNNPADARHRAVTEFHHVVEGQDESGGGVDKEKGIRPSGAMERIFVEKRKREDDAAAQEAEDALNAPPIEEKKEEAPEKRARHERFTSGAVAASFTSTIAPIAFKNECRENTEEEERQLAYDKVRKAKKKGYARLVTNFGNLNIELHCDITPTACDNFIRHCHSGYYKNTKFFRLLKNFMMQGGDPDGTGKGGKSAFPGGDYFKDEFDCRLKHDGPGILSMANPGVRNTNRSQFFITLKNAPHCDRKHTVFGRVVGGLDILAVLNELDTDKNDRPIQKIFIKDTVVFTNPFEDVKKEVVVKPKVDADAMWFSNKSDPMQKHAKRDATTVGKYLKGKEREGLTAEEKTDASIPLKRKTLRTQLDFSVF
eukprot:GEMP01014504.1.p1 GENE.GEMP01014504.1~~GEMP01014504.1.p1  ORF type:complete len:524 (-),score=93.80 GEMP01014504.1:1368-2939(-)